MSETPFDPDDPDSMAGENHRSDQPQDPCHASEDASGGDEALDELALRRMLHGAVQELEPSSDALSRLRLAVPARRARRRQAMVGAAASVLLVGTAVPALFHAAAAGGRFGGSAQASSSYALGSRPGPLGDPQSGGDSGGLIGPATRGGTSTGDSGAQSASPSASASGSVPAKSQPPTATMVAASPTCTRPQLGDGTAQAAAPDQAGRIVGSFRVVNVSDATCTISGGGQLTVTAVGSTDPAKIQVVDHTAGDPATALPDPATAPDSVILLPGKAYQVQFEWIPAAGASGCATGTPPASGGTSGSSGGGGDTADSYSSVTPVGGGATPTPPAGDGFTLSHIPEAGSPVAASTTISGACTGTVYRTTALAAQ
jgi:hypothetical protein